MSKANAFLLAVLCGGLWLVCWHINAWGLAWAFFALTAVFGLSWSVQFDRDRRRARVNLATQAAVVSLPPTPPMTTPGSEQLFVVRAADK